MCKQIRYQEIDQHILWCENAMVRYGQEFKKEWPTQ